MKINIYISDPVAYIRGGYHAGWAFGAMGNDAEYRMSDKWAFVQTVEIDESLIDHDAVLKMAEAQIDEVEEQVKAEYADKMKQIEQKRAELLALPGVTK